MMDTFSPDCARGEVCDEMFNMNGEVYDSQWKPSPVVLSRVPLEKRAHVVLGIARALRGRG